MAPKKARKAGPQAARRAPRAPIQRELNRAADATEKSRKSAATLGMFAHRMGHKQGR